MTATIIPWNKTLPTGPADVARATQPPVSVNNATTPMALEPPRLRRSSTFNSTNAVDEAIIREQSGPSPITRIYPHVFDEDLGPGQAYVHIQNAVRDGELAIEAFGEPDLDAVTTHLGQIAAAMRTAYPLTDFNDSLGGVVAFIRRATLVASIGELSRSALNALVYALRSIASNPMLDLEEASDLVDKLANEGWHGEHKVADELVAALIDQSGLDEQIRQALLFPESQVAED